MKRSTFIATTILTTILTSVAWADVSIPRSPPAGNPGSGYSVPRIPVTNPNPGQIGLPRGEKEQLLAQEIAERTGLLEQDRRYTAALTQCARKTNVVEYFDELLTALQSDKFLNLSDTDKVNELLEVRLGIKMVCSQEIENHGIDP